MLSKAIVDFSNITHLKKTAKEYGWWDELHKLLVEIHNGHYHIDDLFPYFMDWCHKLCPKISSIPPLERSCDLSHPADWLVVKRDIVTCTLV